MRLLRTPPLPPESPSTTCIGIWWYDPGRRLALSFLEDPQAILDEEAKERRASGGRHSAGDPDIHPRQSHAELWAKVVEAFPEYGALRFDADPENAERLAFLCIPRGRVVREGGQWLVLCPPSMIGDAQMLNLVLRDYSIPHSKARIVGDEHYAPESPDFVWQLRFLRTA